MAEEEQADPRPTPTLPHWDPPDEDEREWYRNSATGERGYLVTRNGIKCIRKDRPVEDISVPFSEHQWRKEEERRPFTLYQIGAMAYEADRQMCIFLGQYERARKEWQSLTDEDRHSWITEGPDEESSFALERSVLYCSIMQGLAELAE